MIQVGRWYQCKVYNPGFAGRMPFVTFEMLYASALNVGEFEIMWSQDKDSLKPVTMGAAVEPLSMVSKGMDDAF